MASHFGVLLFLSFICDISALSLPELNSLFNCSGISSDFTIRDTFALVEQLNLTSCTEQLSRVDCDSEIKSFIKNQYSPKLGELGAKLLDSPESTCPCISQYESTLKDSIQVIDSFSTYCSIFFPSNTSASQDSAYAECSAAVERTCHEDEPSLEDIFNCVISNAAALRTPCAYFMDSVFASVYNACADDIIKICGTSHPLEVAPCLSREMSSLSPSCQAVYTDFVHSDFPCVNDAKKLCSAQHTVDSVMTCLEAQRNKSILEPSCEDMVNGLTYCNGKNSNRRDHFANSSRGSEGWAEKPPPKHNSGRRHSGGRSPPDKPAPEDSAMTRVRRHRRALGTADVAANSGGGGGSGNMEPPCWASWDQQAGSSSSSSSNRKNRPTDKSASSSSSMDDTESGREEGSPLGAILGTIIFISGVLFVAYQVWRIGAHPPGNDDHTPGVNGYGRAATSAHDSTSDGHSHIEMETRSCGVPETEERVAATGTDTNGEGGLGTPAGSGIVVVGKVVEVHAVGAIASDEVEKRV